MDGLLERLKRRLEISKMELRGYVYVGDRTKDGWLGPLPFYAFKCPVHGLVENYPHGYDNRLECPVCEATNAAASSQANSSSF